MQDEHILKKLNFGLRPTSPPRDIDPGLQTKIPFDMFHIYCSSVCVQNFGKILTILGHELLRVLLPLGGIL